MPALVNDPDFCQWPKSGQWNAPRSISRSNRWQMALHRFLVVFPLSPTESGQLVCWMNDPPWAALDGFLNIYLMSSLSSYRRKEKLVL